jgi:hypothetical protein
MRHVAGLHGFDRVEQRLRLADFIKYDAIWEMCANFRECCEMLLWVCKLGVNIFSKNPFF